MMLKQMKGQNLMKFEGEKILRCNPLVISIKEMIEIKKVLMIAE
jgi:hypothetical protein